ncbi:hypothetical protein Mal4_29270 [Maioricimonas rarisocia]|uniref:Ferritin-like domain protein n=1 Tax=Maioricimonas rarisocia TaxID=2528026 RepID=A0A517Z7Z1_9PLAN|nr:hypothetical protein [Maioricimonas rarisocia]QDU38598.1 hypothetical protein Mal4_29270 [Maioricimonas rarisocia]
MAYHQVRDIFEQVRKFHREFRNALLESEPHQHDLDVEALIELARDEERADEACLARYSSDAEPNILDTWIQYVPDEGVVRTIQEAEVSPGMDLNEIIEKKIEFDDALVQLYAQLGDQVSGPRLQEAFRSLHDLTVRRREQDAWKLLDTHGK